MHACNLPSAFLEERPRSVTFYWGNTGIERLPNKRVSIESWPWRRKPLFFLNSPISFFWDSNLRHFDHESGAIPPRLPTTQTHPVTRPCCIRLFPRWKWLKFPIAKIPNGENTVGRRICCRNNAKWTLSSTVNCRHFTHVETYLVLVQRNYRLVLTRFTARLLKHNACRSAQHFRSQNNARCRRRLLSVS